MEPRPDNEGRYALTQILPGRYILIVRFVGFDEEKIQIDVKANQRIKKDASLEQNRIHLKYGRGICLPAGRDHPRRCKLCFCFK